MAWHKLRILEIEVQVASRAGAANEQLCFPNVLFGMM